jgi:uncharacterized membrane protein
MMEWVIITVQWLHVFLGIFWFGSVLYLNFVVIPSITSLPFSQQGAISQKIAANSNRVILPVASLVIIIGFLRGTVWGSVQSLSAAFGSAYGITFVVATLLGIAVYAWGYFVIRPTAERIQKEAASMEDGKVTATFTALVQRIKLLSLIELAGFLTLLTCMILMRFGY